jgi:hypothetical protein
MSEDRVAVGKIESWITRIPAAKLGHYLKRITIF